MPRSHVPFASIPLLKQIQLAEPVAKDLVVAGIDKLFDHHLSDEGHIACRVEPLVGHDGPHAHEGETAVLEKLEDFCRAAYALGLAVGQMLPSGVFRRGGGR